MSTALVALCHGPASREVPILSVRPLTGEDEAGLRAAPDLGEETWVDVLLAATARWQDGDPLTVGDAAGLTVGDRHALLLAVVAVSFTPRLEWVLNCDDCGAALDVEADVDDLLSALDDARDPDPGLPPFRLPTGADLAAVAREEEPAAALLRRCVGDVRPEVAALVEDAMAVADPLADITLALRCDQCGSVSERSVDPVAEVVARLADASELLADVHALALAYGWTEPEVLALARGRRRDYLTLLADSS